MKIKNIIMAIGLMALGACGGNDDNAAKLKGANFVSDQPGTNITLTFDPTENRIYGRVVNLYNATYDINGDQITFGPMASTMMMGPTDAMETEQAFFQFMETANSYELAGDRLTFKNPDGKEIIFQQVAVLPDDDADSNVNAPAPAASDDCNQECAE